MAYSIQTAVSDGTLEVLDLSIKYMDKSHIFVYVDDVLVDGSAYSYVWITDTRIQIVPAVASGSTLKVIRKTLTDEMWHEFSKGARFSTTSMDDNFEQLLFLAQEYSEGIYVSDFYSDVDLHLKRLLNLGDPINDGDAVNLKTLKAYLPNADLIPSIVEQVNNKVSRPELASPLGSALIGAATYAQLRAYSGDATRIQVGGRENYFDNCGGVFVRTGSAADNDGTVLVDALGRSWKRDYIKGEVKAVWFGIVADWDGTTGTDQTAKIQAAIDSFSGKRVVFDFGSGGIRADSARIDFKRCALKGTSTTQSGVVGGIEIYVGSAGGFYTTIEDNLAPKHENLRITSSATRTANGQILLDLTGLNYPRLSDVLLYGGQIGLKLSKGAVVETHYGNFQNVNCSRCYTGVAVYSGLYAQTHNFYGGRMWDCVEAYANEGTGASDINFYGTAFESDNAIRHAATAASAQTKWFACRNESGAFLDVPAGQFTEVGTYWSGNRRAETLSASAGVLSESKTQIRNIGVNNAVEFGGQNLLPNNLFEFDPSAARTSASIVYGWTPAGATNYSSGKATEGNYIRLERQAASGTVLLTSRKIALKKGRYTFSCGWKKEGYGTGGVVSIDFLHAGVSFGAAGTYSDIAFPAVYPSSELSVYVEILEDVDDFQFRIQCTASTNGRYFYVFQPQLMAGQRSIYSAPASNGAKILWGAAAPTTGVWDRGDIVYNTAPAAAGFIGWICVAAGAPGTWKTFGAITA